MSLEQLQEGRTLAGVEALLRHFFQPVLVECPACGADDCPHWQTVRELAGPAVASLPAPLVAQLSGMRL